MPFTKEQVAIRQTGFTATDMRDLIGEGYGRSATEVVLSKLIEPIETEEEPTVVSEAMELGTDLEPWLLERHARRNDLCVCVDTGPTGGTMRHPQHQHVLATPDGLVMPEGPAGVMPLTEWQASYEGFPVAVDECKTTGLASGAAFGVKRWGEAGTDAVPRGVAAQATWQMGVVEVPVCYVPVLIGNVGYREYRVEFSPDLWALMLEVCDETWEKYVEKGTLPDDPGPSKSATVAITKWFNKAEDKGLVLESTPELTEAALDLKSSMEAQAALKERVETLRNRFRGVIGNAYAIEGASFGKIVWTLPSGRKVLNKDRMIDLLVERTGFGETALEALRAECTTETEGNRTLRSYWKKGE